MYAYYPYRNNTYCCQYTSESSLGRSTTWPVYDNMVSERYGPWWSGDRDAALYRGLQALEARSLAFEAKLKELTDTACCNIDRAFDKVISNLQQPKVGLGGLSSRGCPLGLGTKKVVGGGAIETETSEEKKTQNNQVIEKSEGEENEGERKIGGKEWVKFEEKVEEKQVEDGEISGDGQGGVDDGSGSGEDPGEFGGYFDAGCMGSGPTSGGPVGGVEKREGGVSEDCLGSTPDEGEAVEDGTGGCGKGVSCGSGSGGGPGGCQGRRPVVGSSGSCGGCSWMDLQLKCCVMGYEKKLEKRDLALRKKPKLEGASKGIWVNASKGDVSSEPFDFKSLLPLNRFTDHLEEMGSQFGLILAGPNYSLIFSPLTSPTHFLQPKAINSYIIPSLPITVTPHNIQLIFPINSFNPHYTTNSPTKFPQSTSYFFPTLSTHIWQVRKNAFEYFPP